MRVSEGEGASSGLLGAEREGADGAGGGGVEAGGGEGALGIVAGGSKVGSSAGEETGTGAKFRDSKLGGRGGGLADDVGKDPGKVGDAGDGGSSG
jgi:hypothetical protein